jgi:hypothetical protein
MLDAKYFVLFFSIKSEKMFKFDHRDRALYHFFYELTTRVYVLKKQ